MSDLTKQDRPTLAPPAAGLREVQALRKQVQALTDERDRAWEAALWPK